MSQLYIGLMSGTSLDGIDAALVDFSDAKPILQASLYYDLKPEIRQIILALRQPGFNEIHRLGELDVMLGNEFANAVNLLLQQEKISKNAIRAIGSHGQTIRHQPQHQYPFTLQVGDPNIIAAKTGITTVADFRRRDIAHGGQGAPLVPAFHQSLFLNREINRAIVNIGGIANVTLLFKDFSQPVLGFDTGPGNTLLNAWTEEHLQKSHDRDGSWAAQGTVDKALLTNLLNDPYFQLPAPKSTGQEYFNLIWLKKFLKNNINPADVQATLVELTARSIVDAISNYFPNGEILICGGGFHNQFLISRIRALATHYSVDSTAKYGVDPDWMEAIAFAWLAKQTIEGKPGNLKEVTGAHCEAVLGGVFYS